MIKEKVEQSDLYLYEILKNPVLAFEFINNIDKYEHEEEFKLEWYQKEILCDFNHFVSICTARSVGKTTSEIGIILWILVFGVFPDEYILYTVPNKVHLQPVWEGLVRLFKVNSLLKNFLDSKYGINSADYRISLLNGSILLCRIAGTTGTGANVIGLHTPFILLDEAGYYSFSTWNELQPVLNTFVNGYRLIVAGVPTGLRESNVLYFVDQERDDYTKHRVSALQNPRFTKDDYRKALEDYGGEDSDDTIHLIFGKHGSPVFSIFDRHAFEISTSPVYKLVIDGTKIDNNISEYSQKISVLPYVPEHNRGIIFGIDLGYTEPTLCFILYLDNSSRLKFHAKIKMNRVSYSIQERLIDMLDSKFNPIIIGVDRGSAGIAVIQRLSEAKEYLHKNYSDRIVPIDFSSNTVLGYTRDGEEIKEKTKSLAVSVLQEYSNNHKIIYSTTDLETISELERMTYTKNVNGEVVYRTLTIRGGAKGEDHATSALLCAVLAYYLKNELVLFEKKTTRLYHPKWFV